MTEKPADSKLLGLTARIVSAHAANNEVKPDALSFVIRAVYETLSTIDTPPGGCSGGAPSALRADP